MPCDSPASGRSPQIRSRSPKRVRHSSQAVSGTSASAISVTRDRLLTSPRSEAGQVGDEEPILLRRSSRGGRASSSSEQMPPARNGNVKLPDRRHAGRLRDRAAGSNLSVKISEDRNRAMPGAEDVDRHPGDDVVDAELHRGDRMQQTAQGTAEHADEQCPTTARTSAPPMPRTRCRGSSCPRDRC